MFAPQWLPDADINPKELAKMYKAAQVQADYILKTGDTTDLKELENVLASLNQYAGYTEQANEIFAKFGLMPPAQNPQG